MVKRSEQNSFLWTLVIIELRELVNAEEDCVPIGFFPEAQALLQLRHVLLERDGESPNVYTFVFPVHR